MFIIVVIVVIVFVSIISGSAAAALTSTGTVILGLSWLLQATAQEFLQSIIFVFVKHPFDVGDRVTIYGNTGDMMKGNDYYVVEVSLLYTEFKKMQGHVVQAPNSLLNTLFILNQRRSQGLADPISLKLAFGTTEQEIEELKSRVLEFCLQNKRDYAPRILSEVTTIEMNVMSITLKIIILHKGNYQNELLRLSRHNRFAVELMRQIREIGLRGPMVCLPGGGRDVPVFLSQVVQQGGGPPAYSNENINSGSNLGGNKGEDVSVIGGGGGGGVGGNNSSTSLNNGVSPAAPTIRRRANSRTAVVEAGMDFQDIYGDRREMNSGGGNAHHHRFMHSPREEDEVEKEICVEEDTLEKEASVRRASVESGRNRGPRGIAGRMWSSGGLMRSASSFSRGGGAWTRG